MGTSPSTGASSREEDRPAPAKLFPQWREVEQDFWLDMFETYSETLLSQNPEEDALKFNYDLDRCEPYMVQKIKLAAKLADEATKEMIYRFERQKPLKQQRSRDRGDDRRKKTVRRPW